MILSVIIISHNQKEQFRRCIDSVLSQDLPFEYEIIVSDDASTDGTWEAIQEYEAMYPGIVKGYQCNSNDCNPANNSHRSGWNRCNAYPHATGKYIAHVDADDYFRPGADVYKKQVEALENHPECSLAMSNAYKVYEGEVLSETNKWHKFLSISNNTIITAERFIKETLFILNQAFIQRRNPDVNPVQLYGKRYVDAVITFHHLQYGSIIYVDSCDYIYIRQKNSITDELSRTKDTDVVWCLGIYIPSLMPIWRHYFYLADYNKICNVVRMSRSGYKLQNNNKKGLEGLGVYIYDTFNRRLSLFDKVRIDVLLLYMRFVHYFNLNKRLYTGIMYLLLSR